VTAMNQPNPLEMLGPNAQPHPVGLNLVLATGPDLKSWVVAVFSTPTGTTGVWLTHEQAADFGGMFTAIAEQARLAAAGLTIATGMPAPGTLPPNVQMNGARP